MRSRPPSVRSRLVVLAVVLASVGAAATVAATATGAGQTPSASLAPPEIAANAASGWPEHNYDLANTRADTATEIDAKNVATLKPKWTFKLTYHGEYGAYTSNPIVLGGYVYLEDPDSDVFALNEATGRVVWEHAYHSVTPSGGPNGVALGYGLLFGATEGSVFALDPRSGKQVWIRRLAANSREGIDMAPQLYGGKVLISTVPGNSSSFYTPDAWGTVYALDARSGKQLWSFSTVKGGSALWGDPGANGGGGLWYPPGVDASGRVFMGTGNPSPYPPTGADPNATSRPGPNLYTDSLVALNGNTGRLLWYQQVTAHDLRDYDFQDPPIVTTQKIGGVASEIVIGAGKSGKVIAFRASDGQRLWTLDIGKHNRYEYGPLPLGSGLSAPKPVTFCPGSLGGVLTPMAESAGTLYVPWIDLCLQGSVDGITGSAQDKPAGGLAAVDAATGRIIWKHPFDDLDAGGATVANDVVFTSTFDGTIYALSTRTGAVLWSTKASDGVNSFPSLTKSMLIVGAGAPSSPAGGAEIAAYSLGGR